jgi:hypothetical protein
VIIGAAPAPDLTSFYAAFTPVCFTLLGLWLIVVQTRHGEWRRSPVHRSRAYVLSINLALPGMMGLLSLIDPGNASLWRAGFAIVAAVAAVLLIGMAIRGPGTANRSLVSVATTWLATVLYVVIVVVALAPKVVSDLSIHLTALEVEELLLSLLVFSAVSVGVFLMFDDVESERDEVESERDEVEPERETTGA